ncbi:ABC-type enterochelin transport system, permease component [Streptococcus anginosus T5]|uniref:ABC-type enterochelin transport system, permease component n=1 Tax=Streptococcus anginosus T5 TaxID=1163302 RepID=A0AAN4PAX8_STRAP|nr:ABC-type enterochelin transport system, permease component [Streptococcus anginosus T5]
MLTSTTTALVGPMMFFGFMMSNLAYLLIKEYQHKWLFSVAILLGFLSLTTGQMLVERVFQLQINVSMVIELVGGLFFFYLLAKEAKR